jgi:hypothetical protein
MAAFGGSTQAVRAAIGLQRAMVHAGIADGIRTALHEGPCIALTRAGKTEFFGETLHRGAALLDVAPESGIAMSSYVAAERDVVRCLLDFEGRRDVVATEHGPYAGSRVTRYVIGPGSSPDATTR